MYLDWALVGTTTCMSRESAFPSKNPPSTSIDEKFVSCSTSTSCSTSSTSIYIFSTYSSSLESLIITNVDAEGENCLQRPHRIFSSPSPIVVTRFSASKIFHSRSFSSPELSLISQNIASGLDASGLM